MRRCRGDVGGVGWMVGDNPVNDIDGGRAAGLRTVWINRGDGWPDGLAGPDHEVSDARAAIDLLIAIQRMRELI
ncbi:HAD hydrolase-like protein [Streptomyces sp. NPDC050610]|uniref:HAD family hydrolase n=1 Tax=Streptomyces sp. NPDC050610 TaxID=3157097 RepID=UPI003434F6D2